MFRRLSTKLSVVFAGLFILAMLMLSIATYQIVSSRAQHIVEDELRTSGDVFLRLLASRSDNMQSDAELLSKDFGFRSAITSGDGPTMTSALENFRNRMEIESAAIVGLDGIVAAVSGELLAKDFDKLVSTLDTHDAGAFFVADQPHLGGVVPLYAPALIGWVAFAERLDRSELGLLESLSAIPLTASVSPYVLGTELAVAPALSGDLIVLEQVLPTFNTAVPAVLRLTYPMSAALAPYNLLLATLGAMSFAGILITTAVSSIVARRLVVPIAALSEAAMKLRDGENAHVAVQTGDEIADLAASFNEMSDGIHERELKIQETARTDRETGLPNRVALEEILSSYGANDTDCFVVAVELDRFTHIRNAIGFDFSANLVAEVGKRMMNDPRIESVSRVSAGLLCGMIRVAEDKEALATAFEVKEALEETLEIGAQKIDVMVSIGLARYDEGSRSIDRATIALDQAREKFEGAAFFDEQAYGNPSGNLSLMGDLLSALENGSIDVAYQPKYDLRSRLPVGVEALVRWKHEHRGMIFPDIFIPIAEETGRIEPLTRYVLAHAIETQKELAKQGFDLSMSVNLSGRLLTDDAFSDEAISMVGDACGTICFEITETAVIDDPDKGIAAIERFAQAGIEISIDDYGSGLSSLAYLKKIPAQELKIDKAFVLQIEDNHRDALLVRSTIELAHNLGMKVTAEGVETPTAAALLAGMRCDVGQGFGLGRPMLLQDLLEHLRAAVDQKADCAQAG